MRSRIVFCKWGEKMTRSGTLFCKLRGKNDAVKEVIL